MNLVEALTIKKHLEREFLTKRYNITKSAGLLEGFEVQTYVMPDDVVNGIGIGYGGDRDAYRIELMVRKKTKVKTTSLASFFAISPQDIRVTYAGEISSLQATARHRPAFPGVSIGHYKGATGSFGCLAMDEERRLYIVSNNHVLANLNSASLGDEILQPGPADGGTRKDDVIARLFGYVPLDFQGLNRVDAALAEPVDYSDVLPANPWVGSVEGTAVARINSRVMKFGRTTGLTIGVVQARNATIKVNMGKSIALFEDQIVVKGAKGRFSDNGDSGALLLDMSRHAVGLLFAGSSSGLTFANPIEDVLTCLGVEIL